MNDDRVEQIIKEQATENFNLYEDSYPLRDDSTATQEAIENARDLAKGYYQERNELEIERDEKLEIHEEDYVQWVEWAFEDWVDEKAANKKAKEKGLK